MARAFTILGNAMTALDYYRQLVDPGRLPQINIVLTDPFLVDEDNYSFYSPNKTNMIYITPDSEWSFWAVAHETSHYFDGGILVEGGIDNYGSWGEPMANVRAGMIIGSSWMAAREWGRELLDGMRKNMVFRAGSGGRHELEHLCYPGGEAGAKTKPGQPHHQHDRDDRASSEASSARERLDPHEPLGRVAS